MGQYKITTVYNHTQSVPATEWNIQHYLATYPSVDAVILHEGKYKKILPKTVEYVDANNCKVTFSTAQSGFAKVVS